MKDLSFESRKPSRRLRWMRGSRSVWFNCVAFSILFIGYFLTTGTSIVDGEISKVAYRLIALLVLVLNVLLNRKIRIEYLIGIFVIFTMLSMNRSEIAANFIFFFIATASLAKQNSKEVAICFLLPASLMILLHNILFLGGFLIDQQTNYFDRQRSTLGFSNANQVAGLYLSFSIIAVYTHIVFQKRWSIILGFSVIGATAFIFQLTDSRTATFTLLLLVTLQILGFGLSQIKGYRLLLALCASATFSFGTLATYYITTSSDPTLDFFLSFRPYFFSRFMSSVETTDFLFGWSTRATGGTDNGYLMLLSGVGAIIYLILLFAISVRVFRTDHKLIPILIALLVGSIFESFLLRPEIPASLLFFHILLSRSSLRSISKRTT